MQNPSENEDLETDYFRKIRIIYDEQGNTHDPEDYAIGRKISIEQRGLDHRPYLITCEAVRFGNKKLWEIINVEEP